MARTKAQDEAQRVRTLKAIENSQNKQITQGAHIPPQNRRAAELAASQAKMAHAQDVLSAVAATFDVMPVKSNHELSERIRQYFAYCQEKEILPTVEGLALFIGYHRSTLFDWKTGRNHGFRDVLESGDTTSDLVKKAIEILACFDGTLAVDGTLNAIPYIYRSQNYYGLQNRQSISVEPPEAPLRPPLTPEEIARNLPELDYTENLPSAFDMEGGGADDAGR